MTSMSSSMPVALTKSSLSAARRRLVEILQELNYGRMDPSSLRAANRSLAAREKCGKSNSAAKTTHGQRTTGDFALSAKHIEMFAFRHSRPLQNRRVSGQTRPAISDGIWRGVRLRTGLGTLR